VGIDADHDGVVVTTLWPKRDRFTWEELKDIEYEIAHPGQGPRYYRLVFCLADHRSPPTNLLGGTSMKRDV
jgi:hypothetical protein